MNEDKLSKIELRKKFLKIRKDITNKDSKSLVIFNKIIKEDYFINSKVIALYNNLNSEVSTKELIDYSLILNKTVLLPRVVNDDLLFYKIDCNSIYSKSSFGVLEPSLDNKLFRKEDIDLIIVPGVVFDVNRNRIGFGKGFYDRFFKGCKALKVGICFDEQIIESIPFENNDIKLDIIVSDKRNIK